MPDRSPINTALASLFMELKTDQRMTFPEIATKSGLSQSSVDRYLRGQRGITVTDLGKLAAAFGADPFELYKAAEARVKGKD